MRGSSASRALLYADASPVALSHALVSGWPSGAIRRSSKPSFRLRGRRFTFGLMVQPEALRGFLERAGTLPRSGGFIARSLIAWPASTQGTRSYRVAPRSMPAAERFGLRIRELLETPLCTHADGGLQPLKLALSPPRMLRGCRRSTRIECALAAGGDFADIRDAAGKAAENIARLAALFHVLAPRPGGVVDAEAVQAAATVIGWHLHEARRLLSDLDTPTEIVAAIRLNAWLIAEARRCGDHRIPTRRVYQFGPDCVQDAKAMKAVLATQSERSRARLEDALKRRLLVVNPALVGRWAVEPRPRVEAVATDSGTLLLLRIRVPAHGRRLHIASRNCSNSRGGNDLTPEGTCCEDLRA